MFDRVLGDIEEAARKNIDFNENDYVGDDGLMYCGNCNTPKQVRVVFLEQEKTPRCLCACEAAKQAEEQRKREQQAFMGRVHEIREAAFPDSKTDELTPEGNMREWTFAHDDMGNPKLSQIAKKYVEGFDGFKRQGVGLLLYGDTGTGKSYMAGCIANALIDKGYSVLMTSCSSIADTIFALSDKREYYKKLNRYSLLILDDLGAERDTQYMHEIVYNVIDGRSNAGLPLIVTSNITGDELKNPADKSAKRVYSRVLGMCHPVKVDGEDRRKKKAVARFADMQKKLGL